METKTETKPQKGHERREMTADELTRMIHRLRDAGIPSADRKANVLVTLRMLRDEVGYVELGKKMWKEIDDLLDVHGAQVAAEPEKVLSYIEDFPAPMLEEAIEQLKEVDEVPDEAIVLQYEADTELDSDALPLCRCGCGGHTKGGHYLPGHDAKHKGILMRRVLRGSGDGVPQTQDAAAAWVELNIRGWSHFYEAFARNEAKRERRRNQVTCRICNRPLFDEESVAAGIGPVCQGHGK